MHTEFLRPVKSLAWQKPRKSKVPVSSLTDFSAGQLGDYMPQPEMLGYLGKIFKLGLHLAVASNNLNLALCLLSTLPLGISLMLNFWSEAMDRLLTWFRKLPLLQDAW